MPEELFVGLAMIHDVDHGKDEGADGSQHEKSDIQSVHTDPPLRERKSLQNFRKARTASGALSGMRLSSTVWSLPRWKCFGKVEIFFHRVWGELS
jgi:hypothetical protein